MSDTMRTKILKALFPFIGILFLVPSFAQASLATGLLGWWTFDTNHIVPFIADSSSNGNNGYSTGGATTTVTGVLGQALNFDGISNRIVIPMGSQVGVGTVSLWINPSALPSVNVCDVLFTFQDGTGNSSFAYDKSLALYSTNSTPATEVTAYLYDGSQREFQSTTNIPTGEWQLVTLTFDGTTARIYINGTQENTDAVGTTYTGYANPTIVLSPVANEIGMPLCPFIRPYTGAEDDVRVYNRALSAAEVKQLYQNGVGSIVNKEVTTGTGSNGLVGWWTFDGPTMVSNVGDSSGQGNNGDLVGYTSTTTVPGVSGQALSFNGTSQYASIPNSSSINLGTTITLSAWVNPTSLHDYGNIFEKFPVNLAGGYGIITYANGSWGFQLFPHVSSDPCTTPAGTLTNNTWYLVTATYDGTTAKCYTNGQLTAQAAWSPANFATITDPLNIGSDISFSRYFTGVIDGARVYNRALSAAEVKQLYLNSVGSIQNVSANTGTVGNGMIGWWTFDGKNMINNVTDSSGQGNNGDLVNFTSTTTVPGVMGQALSFNGTNQYTKLGTAGGSLTNITASAWIYPTSYTSTAETIWGVGSTNSSTGYAWWLRMIGDTDGSPPTAGHAHLEMREQWNGGGGAGTDIGLCTTINIPLNKWAHVVVVANGVSTVFYVNGVSEGNSLCLNTNGSDGGYGPASFAQPAGTILSTLGTAFYLNADINEEYPGYIDDLRIYNRALSAAEIKQLYQIGKSGTVGSAF